MLAGLQREDWSPCTCVLGLHALRIVSRQHNGCSQLTGRDGVGLIVRLAGLDVLDVEKVKQMRNSEDMENTNGWLLLLVQ